MMVAAGGGSGSQLLQLTPAKEISFSGTNFADTTHPTVLRLENISRTNVAFKVKTTALKAFLVNPSSSILEPGKSVDVQIMLQRLPEVPPNHKHRFLVQAVGTEETSLEGREAWPQLVKDKTITEFRLSVVFADVIDKMEKAIIERVEKSIRETAEATQEVIRSELAKSTRAIVAAINANANLPQGDRDDFSMLRRLE